MFKAQLSILEITQSFTIKDLKGIYKKLASANHPDKGGSTEKMQLINGAYESIKEYMTSRNIEVFEIAESTTDKDFKDDKYSSKLEAFFNEIIDYPNLTIEIIGVFVWVTGDTKPAKDWLKEKGAKWHKTKKCWFFAPENWKSNRWSKNTDLDDIRTKYGSTTVRRGKKSASKPASKISGKVYIK